MEIDKDTGGLCYGIVYSESQHVVRGSVVLQCYAGPGMYQEEVYIYIYIYIYIHIYIYIYINIYIYIYIYIYQIIFRIAVSNRLIQIIF